MLTLQTRGLFSSDVILHVAQLQSLFLCYLSTFDYPLDGLLCIASYLIVSVSFPSKYIVTVTCWHEKDQIFFSIIL